MQSKASISSNVSRHSKHRLQKNFQPQPVVQNGRRKQPKQQKQSAVSLFGLFATIAVIAAVVMLLVSQHHLMHQVETRRVSAGLQNTDYQHHHHHRHQVPPRAIPSKTTPQFLSSEETKEGIAVQRPNSIRQRNEEQEVGHDWKGIAAPNKHKVEKETKRNAPLEVEKKTTKVPKQEQSTSAPEIAQNFSATNDDRNSNNNTDNNNSNQIIGTKNNTTNTTARNRIRKDMISTSRVNTTGDLSKTIAYVISVIKCEDRQTNIQGLIDAALVLRHSVHMTSSRNPESGSKYDYHMIALVRKDTMKCANVLHRLGFDDVIIVKEPIAQKDIRGQDLRKYIHKELCCGHCEYDEKWTRVFDRYSNHLMGGCFSLRTSRNYPRSFCLS